LTIESEQSLRLYAFGWLLWLGFAAFLVGGFFLVSRSSSVLAVLFFSPFAYLGAKAGFFLAQSTGRYFDLGTLRLELQAASPVVGGALKGVIRLPRSQVPASIEAELACEIERKVLSAEGKWTLGREGVVSEKRSLEIQRDGLGRFVEIDFPIAATAPASGRHQRREAPAYIWELRLKALHAGHDLERTFTLDVPPQGSAPARAVGSSRTSAVVLVAANLVPLALVLSGKASVATLVALYWAENVVIGFYTVLRMLLARRDTRLDKLGPILFFCGHYGGFCLLHGIFVMAIFLGERSREMRADWPFPFYFLQLLWSGAQAMGLTSSGIVMASLLALFISHGVSLVQNYIRNGRYLVAHAGDSFWRPYPRVLLLHLLIVAGAWFIDRHGSPLPMLVGLVLGKTVIDLLLHQRANR
jgi:hypothetical protein